MPDFERVMDKLQQGLATTPEDKAFWSGYSKGKSKARLEILFIAVALYFVIAAIGAYT